MTQSVPEKPKTEEDKSSQKVKKFIVDKKVKSFITIGKNSTLPTQNTDQYPKIVSVKSKKSFTSHKYNPSNFFLSFSPPLQL